MYCTSKTVKRMTEKMKRNPNALIPYKLQREEGIFFSYIHKTEYNSIYTGVGYCRTGNLKFESL